MAFITSFSFLLGANCSALSGYAGIWVSVRANVRVAAAARKCYNDSIQICFRGGAFSAIINVALAIFGISFMYLCMSFIFYMNGADSKEPPI
jgi:H+-translocating diphosphatase